MRQNAKENTLFPAKAGQWHGFRPGWLAFPRAVPFLFQKKWKYLFLPFAKHKIAARIQKPARAITSRATRRSHVPAKAPRAMQAPRKQAHNKRRAHNDHHGVRTGEHAGL